MAASPPATPPELGRDVLYAVIGAIARGPDLDHLLPAVVDLLAEATGCHACFVYVREEDRLRLRAASPVFADVVGEVVLGMDEGLCGWVARHRTPAFIPDRALEDPRMRYVPELREERFQSMVAVPLLDRGGEAIGVVVLHTEAPREFGPDVLDLLVHVASLVAGAIDAARLYDEARRRVDALSVLVGVTAELVAAPGRAALYEAACDGVRRTLRCRTATLHVAGDPVGPDAVVHAPDGGRMAVRVGTAQEPRGVLVAERDGPFGAEEVRLVEAVANQLAVALQRTELIERLTEEHLARDLLDGLAGGRDPRVGARATAAGVNLSGPHVVAVVEPVAATSPAWWPELAARAEARLRRLAPGALCDADETRLRALVPLPSGTPVAARLARLDAELERLGVEEGLVAGRSEPRRGLREGSRSLQEATAAARVAHALAPAGGARSHGELGAFRYLAGLAGQDAPDDRHGRAVAELAAYDARRRTSLLPTLERWLGDRQGVLATARSLVIHPNTLRQRLERVEELTGLVLAEEDLLSLELAVKVHRLRGAPAQEDRLHKSAH